MNAIKVRNFKFFCMFRQTSRADVRVFVFSSQKIGKLLATIKSLRRDLLSDLPRPEKPMPPTIEEVERRLLEETIAEVVGEELESPESRVNVREEADKRGGFLNILNQEPNISGSPSLHRDFGEISAAPISIREVHQSALADIGPAIPDFEEASLNEIADLGMFAGDHGRQLYDSVKTREALSSADISCIARQRYEERNLSASTPVIKVLVPPAFGSDSIQSIRDQSRKETLPAPMPMDLDVEDIAGPTADKSLIAPEILPEPREQQDVSQPPENVQPLEPIEPQIPAQDENVIEPTAPEVPVSRTEYFQRMATELEAKNRLKSKARRRHRRKQQRSPSPDESEFLELNRPLMFHKRKPKSTVAQPTPVRLYPMFDMLDGIEFYGPDQVLDDELVTRFPDEIIEPMLQDAQDPPAVPANVVQEDPIPNLEAPEIEVVPVIHEIPRLSLPEVEPEIIRQVTKRARKQFGEVSLAETSVHAIPVEGERETSNLLVPRESMASRPQSYVQVTREDLEFAHLRDVSEQVLQPDAPEAEQLNPIEQIVKVMAQAKSTIERANQSEASQRVTKKAKDDRVLFRVVQGKVEKMVEYVGVNYTIEKHSEYAMEVRLINFKVAQQLTQFFVPDNVLVLANSILDEISRILEIKI